MRNIVIALILICLTMQIEICNMKRQSTSDFTNVLIWNWPAAVRGNEPALHGAGKLG